MEPQVHYARTSDGVNIAFSVAGGGATEPFVWLPGPPFSHAELSWKLPAWGARLDALAKDRLCVFIDLRGQGLSDRDVAEISLRAYLLDLAAVVGRLRLEKFSVQGIGCSGPVAIAYAAENPEQVSCLILRDTFARASEMASVPEARSLGALLRRGAWEMYCDSLGHLIYGWNDTDEARELTTLLKATSSVKTAQALVDGARSFDVTDLLPHVKAPTLVLHRRGSIFSTDAMARNLASGIPGARLVSLEGRAETIGNAAEEVRIINEFLGERQRRSEPPELPSGTAIILFADIVDSTALTEHMGDAAYRDKARRLDSALRKIIRDGEGTPIEGNVLGDGVMAVFTSAAKAIEAALACGRAGAEAGLPLHLGLHAGDVIREGNNVFGGAVNIASRISGLSAPGEVLVSDTLRGLARTSAGVSFEDRGEQSLKGVGEAVRVFAVRTT